MERAAVFSTGHATLSNTVGVYIAARGRAGGAGNTVRQVLKVPMLYAVLLALLFRTLGVSFSNTLVLGGMDLALLPAVYKAAKMLAQASLALFMLVLGMQLGDTKHGKPLSSKRFDWPLLWATFTRLVVSPVLALGLTRLMKLEELASKVTILQAAMPSAVLTVIIATEFKAKPQFVTAAVISTTLFSMITVTILLGYFGVR